MSLFNEANGNDTLSVNDSEYSEVISFKYQLLVG